MAALGTGLMFHHFSILGQNGIGRATAALMFVPLGMVTAGMNLGTGVLLDRFQPRIILGVMLLLFAALLVAIPLVTVPAAVWTYGTIMGAVQGMLGALMGSAYAHYFGRDNLGAIKGFAKTLLVGGSAIGPLIYGLGYEITGNYALPLVLSALVPLAIALVAPFATRGLPKVGDPAAMTGGIKFTMLAHNAGTLWLAGCALLA